MSTRHSLLSAAFSHAAASTFKQWLWRRFYDGFAVLCARRYEADAMPLALNYGYADDRSVVELTPAEEASRYGLQLYHFVCHALDLTDRTVLDVSCGHGAGSQYIGSHLKPRAVIGVDQSQRAVRWCAERIHVPNVHFVSGEAGRLPIGDRRVDVVVNVEASHCYPDAAAFLREVRRVLRPGGVLTWTDLGSPAEIDAFKAALEEHRFRIQAETDIADNVRLALDRDSARKRAEIRRRCPWPLRRAIGDFAAVTGSRNYRKLVTGQHRYVHIVAQPA